MKRLCSLLMAVVFAFSLSLAQDAVKPQDTQTPPEKKMMKTDKKKVVKAKKKVAKDKKMKKSSMMKADSTK